MPKLRIASVKFGRCEPPAQAVASGTQFQVGIVELECLFDADIADADSVVVVKRDFRDARLSNIQFYPSAVEIVRLA